MPIEQDNAAVTNGGTSAETSQSQQSGNSGPETNSTTTTTASSTEQTPSSASSKGESGGGEAGKKEEAPKSALDAVLRVMKPATAPAEKKDETKTAAGEQPDEKEHKAAGEDEPDWISREQYAKLEPVVRRRIGKLTEQRNEARDQAKAFEPKAKTYDDLSGYCKGAGLSAEDFTFGLEIMALIKSDPAKAYEALQPIIRDLQGHVGEILPADLAKEVEAGTISEVRAKELAAARRENQRIAQRSTQQTETEQRDKAVRTVQENHDKVTSAIKTWETTWASKDPDYKKKSGRVFERMMVLMQGKDITPASAVQYAEQAKKDVEEWLKGILPAPREIKRGPEGGSGGSTKKAPTSALEAARQAVEATRQAA